ncbi:LysR family transcriptional regulator [Aliigemmobacter aestuarii]|uniref:LysR family transcriptional regulator n=1 Tax=Aliigemmobacter aestuarii TaxID=1445661 RepID=A0A4S3MPT5_9RHOB|nr:LysR family transcriptional regulator [Gemmobacter aestuarii]THD84458.1 LysR family transcriptional regulator [Gemmobacter aestuarii]
MQIEFLETFLDLVETRSFNRTAERMGLTQSTVSGRVSALEQALGGVRLFRRSRAGTELTTEGLKFETHARNLRREWTEARRRMTPTGEAALSVKLGIQNDLAARHIGDWVADFRRALPQTSFYIEPDYSAQMCADLVTGVQDFAVLFSPKPHPDLHFATVGEVRYRMVSSDADRREGLVADRYIFAHFSPAFEAAHRAQLPELSGAALSVGQSASVAALLGAMGGAGYVLEDTAADLIGAGRFRAVQDAPVLSQPVYAAMHLRNRTAPLHRRLTAIVSRNLARR